MTDLHISGPCQAAYARGCRCNDCRAAWREGRRRQRGWQPSQLAVEVDRLNACLVLAYAELDAAEAHVDALRDENAMLYARLQDHEWANT